MSKDENKHKELTKTELNDKERQQNALFIIIFAIAGFLLIGTPIAVIVWGAIGYLASKVLTWALTQKSKKESRKT